MCSWFRCVYDHHIRVRHKFGLGIIFRSPLAKFKLPGIYVIISNCLYVLNIHYNDAIDHIYYYNWKSSNGSNRSRKLSSTAFEWSLTTSPTSVLSYALANAWSAIVKKSISEATGACRKKSVFEDSEARGAGVCEKKCVFNEAAVMSDKGKSAGPLTRGSSAAKRYGSSVNQNSIQLDFK